MIKKRDSQRVRKPRQTTVENRTVIVRSRASNVVKPEELYTRESKKAHEYRSGGKK